MGVSAMYCNACLSLNRRMYPVHQLRDLFLELRCEFDTAEGGVCWECAGLVTKFHKFQMQVKTVQRLLLAKKQSPSTQLKTLSKISPKNIDSYDYIFSHYDPKDTEKEVDMKEEYDSDKYENNSNSEEKLFNNEDYEESAKNCVKICDMKLVNSTKIYVEPLKLKLTNRDKAKKKIAKDKERKGSKIKEENDDEEKFVKIIFTEEQMELNREQKRSHPNYKKIPYKCNSCVIGFTRRDTYELHMKKLHDESIGPHVCKVCQVRYRTLSSLARHESTHYVSYQCLLCRYKAVAITAVRQHCLRTHSRDKPQAIHCTKCEEVLTSPEELAQHVNSAHGFICNECGQKFKEAHSLRVHLSRTHGAQRPYTCDVCHKSFKTQSRLEVHRTRHGANIAKSLSYCSLCKVQYKNIYVYRNHLRNNASHAADVYECKECQKKFVSKGYLKRHHEFYHLHKSQYKCQLCSKLFISSYRLVKHRQTQHGASRSRDCTCNVCGKKFHTLSTLKSHRLIHSDQRSYMCEDCGDTFKQRAALYNHYKLVHKKVKRAKTK